MSTQEDKKPQTVYVPAGENNLEGHNAICQYDDDKSQWDYIEDVLKVSAILLTPEEYQAQQKLITRLKELKRNHINPYNLGDMGEISKIIDRL